MRHCLNVLHGNVLRTTEQASETRIREIRLLRAKKFEILTKNRGDQIKHLEVENR
jgi:hypothetical protein